MGWMYWMRQPDHPQLTARVSTGTVRARSLSQAELAQLDQFVGNPPVEGPRYISRNQREQLQAWRRGQAAVARRQAREGPAAAPSDAVSTSGEAPSSS